MLWVEPFWQFCIKTLVNTLTQMFWYYASPYAWVRFLIFSFTRGGSCFYWRSNFYIPIESGMKNHLDQFYKHCMILHLLTKILLSSFSFIHCLESMIYNSHKCYTVEVIISTDYWLWIVVSTVTEMAFFQN